MSTDIKIDPQESKDADCIISFFADAVIHFELSHGGCSIPRYTVMMAEGRLQGITGSTRERSIEATADALRKGHKFAIDKRPTQQEMRLAMATDVWQKVGNDR